MNIFLLKKPGTHKETPWHQDMPYYCVDGNDTGSFWIPLDNVDNKNNLQLILGSHKWPKLVRPTKWSNNQSWYQDDSSFMDLPSSEEFKNNILIPELKFRVMLYYLILKLCMGLLEIILLNLEEHFQ